MICCFDEIPHVCVFYLLLQLLLQLADDVLLLLHRGLQLLAALEQTHLGVSGLAVWSFQLLLHPLHLKSHIHAVYTHTYTHTHTRNTHACTDSTGKHTFVWILTCW